jgi:ribosomal protein L37AE/L43A
MTEKAHHRCPNCHAASIAVRLSRYVNERCVSNFWSCEACGYEFETSAHFSDMKSAEVSQSITSDKWCVALT